ncbi:MAG: HNH endonuclease [Promethearchaeota archaeon]|nr:MAG: HNH endonuclease [Candidatus Lokiarchaeota archaeon]
MNRKNSRRTDRFAPSIKSKIEAHLRELSFVQRILPITHVIIEAGMFDPHALQNSEVLNNPQLYQRGLNYGFNNTKAYVLHRDGYTCQHCRGKSKDKRLHSQHIIFKEHGGSDHADNLIALCKTCHDQLHAGQFTLRNKGKKKGTLKHATQMNVIRTKVLKISKATETFGYITKTHREALGLKKNHAIDAVVFASKGKPLTFKIETGILKKCVAKGDYQQTKGVRSERRILTGKIQGFRKFDKVRYEEGEYFIKGRMSSGYAVLMDITGKKKEFRPLPKFSNMKRLSARTSQMVMECSLHLASEGASFLEQSI